MAMTAQERRKRKKLWNRTFRLSIKADGTCVRCCKFPATVGALCPECRALNDEWTAAFRADPSHCKLCRSARSPGKDHCERHLARARARSKRNRKIDKRARRPRAISLVSILASGARMQTDLASVVGRSHRVVLRWLAQLQTEGLVDRWVEGEGKGGCGWTRLTLAGRREADRLAAITAADMGRRKRAA